MNNKPAYSVNTARCAFWHPYMRPIYTGALFDTRTYGQYLFTICTSVKNASVYTGRKYGSYIRVVFTGTAYRALLGICCFCHKLTIMRQQVSNSHAHAPAIFRPRLQCCFLRSQPQRLVRCLALWRHLRALTRSVENCNNKEPRQFTQVAQCTRRRVLTYDSGKTIVWRASIYRVNARKMTSQSWTENKPLSLTSRALQPWPEMGGALACLLLMQI